MKILYAFLLLVHLTLSGTAQTLSIGQVYNFSVGDTIQGLYLTPWSSVDSTFETRIILNKILSVNNDTIFYTVKKEVFSPPSAYSVSTFTDTVTSLASIAHQNNNTDGCLGAHDSTYTDSCGNLNWEVKANSQSLSCTGLHFAENTWLISGLGGPYYNYITASNFPPEGHISFMLTYYSKSGNKCGKFSDGIRMLHSSFLPEIYPNPANETVNFHLHGTETTITLTDMLGNKIAVIPNGKAKESFDTRNLPNGVYFAELKTSEGVASEKFVVQH